MQLTNRRVRLMGTVIDVSIYHEEPTPLLDQVEALLHTYNKRFSANDDSSELMKINKAAGLILLSDLSFRLGELAFLMPDSPFLKKSLHS